MRHSLGTHTVIFAILLFPFVASSQADEEHSVFAVAYRVDNLAVWRLDKEGEPQFDTTVLIAYLKPHFKANTAFNVVDDKLLFVSATRDVHTEISEALQRLRAFADEDASDALEQLLSDALHSRQHVLLFVSEPHSEAANLFFDAQFDYENEVLQRALYNYRIQCVHNTDTDLLNSLGMQVSKKESLLAVLSAQGNILAKVAIDKSTVDKPQFVDLLAELLTKHWNVLPSAAEVIATGYEQAAKDDKRVLVQVSGPNCGPCLLLSRYFEAQKSLLDKDYVLVKLDIRMADADPVITELRKDKNGSIPWMAILTHDGKVLVTSDGESGNIGYPQAEASREHFRKMLTLTSQRLTESERNTLIEEVGKE